MNNKDAERLNGTIDFFLKGQYGIIKGEDGKEYFFGKSQTVEVSGPAEDTFHLVFNSDVCQR